MPELENVKETEEETNVSAGISALETPEAKDYLGPTEKTLIDSMKNLSLEEKLDAFRQLESKCAELEDGRNPRAVEATALAGKGELFRSSEERIEVDKENLSDWKQMGESRLSDLKKHVFSISDVRLNHGGAVSFGRSCSDKCIDCDVESGRCSWG